MKRILIVLSFLLMYVVAGAQNPINNYTWYNFYGNVHFKGKMFLPVKDTTFIPDSLFSLTIRPQDSLPYVGVKTTSGGVHWVAFKNWIGATGGGGSIDTTLFHSTNYHNTLYPQFSGAPIQTKYQSGRIFRTNQPLLDICPDGFLCKNLLPL